ncbi:hypothetical protein AMELA_G00164640 [Ameiurus melas]|uniref:Immunoglobulin V-set domain-containing protein n=1 Tax=Ameiurus melas TaxID=219545 RepID=A0A7J6AI56_AMEME|nr:hypothetical protein AMELA_G00164640 [Ameiurus melas]
MMCVLSVTCLLLCVSVHTASSDISNQIHTEGSDTFLFCVNDGKVIWSKGVDGGRGHILTAEHGEITIKNRPDPDNRYSVFSDSSLHIKNLSLSDSGIYYCNSVPVVNLTVTPSHGEGNKSTQTTPTTTTSTGVIHCDNGTSQNITPITSVEQPQGSSDTSSTERTSEENKSTQTTPTTTTSTGVTHRDNGASQNITTITSVEQPQGSSDTSTTVSDLGSTSNLTEFTTASLTLRSDPN